jgi:hypothetical protein
VATEGFSLAAEMIRRSATGSDGFLGGGQTYLEFALTHRGYFEAMFRPYLYGGAGPKLLETGLRNLAPCLPTRLSRVCRRPVGGWSTTCSRPAHSCIA